MLKLGVLYWNCNLINVLERKQSKAKLSLFSYLNFAKKLVKRHFKKKKEIQNQY